MEKERIQLEKNSRTLQQCNAGSANIMDNRPDGSRNYLSGIPLQRVEEDDEDVLQGKLSTPVQRVEEDDEDVLQGKLSTPVQRVEGDEEDPLGTAVQRKKKGVKCNTIQGLIVTPQLIHFLGHFGITGAPLNRLIDSITNNTGHGGFGATGYSWNGHTVYHETFAGIRRSVFYSYYQNNYAVILGIGFHAPRTRSIYTLHLFSRPAGPGIPGRAAIDINLNGMW